MAFPLRFVGKLDGKLNFTPRTSVLLKKSKGQLHELAVPPAPVFLRKLRAFVV